jgi:hypothetical protein
VPLPYLRRAVQQAIVGASIQLIEWSLVPGEAEQR